MVGETSQLRSVYVVEYHIQLESITLCKNKIRDGQKHANLNKPYEKSAIAYYSIIHLHKAHLTICFITSVVEMPS